MNGHTYDFAVSAYNKAGEGQRSPGVSVTPGLGNSSAPTGLSAIPGNTQVALSWSTPDNDGGAPIDYYVIYRNGSDVKHVLGNSVNITGLENGRSYSFTVAAHNIAGMSGNSSSVQAIPFTVPDAPNRPTAFQGDRQVTLNWTAPNSEGRSIDYYVVYQDGTALPDHPAGLSTIIHGLTNGQTYSFNVSAHNLAGSGQESIAVTATPSPAPTVPGAPTGLVATPGNAQVSLSWTAPISNGGSPIDYYIVYQNGTDITHPTSTTQIVPGLKTGVSYTFMVAAHNAIGKGARSSGVSVTLIRPHGHSRSTDRTKCHTG